MKLDFFKEWDWVRKGKPDQAVTNTIGIALYDWALPVHIAVNAALHLEDGDFSIAITVLCFYWEFSIWKDRPLDEGPDDDDEGPEEDEGGPDLADRMVEALKT